MWENTGAAVNGVGYPSQRSRRECERARDSRARPCDKAGRAGGGEDGRGGTVGEF